MKMSQTDFSPKILSDTTLINQFTHSKFICF